MMLTVYGTEITDSQIAAGVAAMTGDFRAHQVEAALIRAGVADGMISARAADRLLQRERKAGRIKASNNKNWRPVVNGEPVQ